MLFENELRLEVISKLFKLLLGFFMEFRELSDYEWEMIKPLLLGLGLVGLELMIE